MVIAARVAEKLTLASPGLTARLSHLLQRVGLPVSYAQFSPAQVWDAMTTDKKKRGSHLRFILPRAIGEVIVAETVPRTVVWAALAESKQ